MKDKLEQLRMDFEKLKLIGEMYEELVSKEITNERELEEAKLKYEAMKNQALRLSLHSKNLIQKIETEDIP
jgi:hypothetical protein